MIPEASIEWTEVREMKDPDVEDAGHLFVLCKSGERKAVIHWCRQDTREARGWLKRQSKRIRMACKNCGHTAKVTSHEANRHGGQSIECPACDTFGFECERRAS